MPLKFSEGKGRSKRGEMASELPQYEKNMSEWRVLIVLGLADNV